MTSMLTTVAGFAASCVLSLPLSISFGLLTATAIVFVYLGSMFVLPVLLQTFGADVPGTGSDVAAATGRTAVSP